MVKMLRPAIERKYEMAENVLGSRKRCAEEICDFLTKSPLGLFEYPLERESFYSACEILLSDRDSERILLYLPFRYLDSAPESFRNIYMKAWRRLLDVHDVRENFHLGDCFEIDARPREGLERVVKCAHLLPWLLRFGYLSSHQVSEILKMKSDDMVLLQSFKDTWGYVASKGILKDDELQDLKSKTAILPARKKQEPLYSSKKRAEWLEEHDKPVTLLTPDAHLAGPFSPNLRVLNNSIQEIVNHLGPDEIVLIGGSLLKGYGTTDSDLDVWNYRSLLNSQELKPGSPFATHIYYDTVWLSRDYAIEKLEQITDEALSAYARIGDYAIYGDLRRQAVERLEQDLLQYRLLHKGFARFTGRRQTTVPVEMDGDCAFYDDEYRCIATMLYAKYVKL